MRYVTAVAALGLLLAVTGTAEATGITLDVYPSSAPNAYGSPSWAQYMANALNSLENGLGNVGDRSTDPTAYEIAPPVIEPGEIAVTSFNSWRGQINPPSPFDNEYGNRMHFGLHAYGDGTTQFALEDLTFEMHSTDPGDSLAFSGDFIAYNYNGTSRYGIDWGSDDAKGGGDDTVYTSGNGTTLVDELVYVGVGNAWWPGGDAADPSNPPEGAQAAMDDYVAWVTSIGPEVSCTYEINGYTGSASVDVVPEPVTMAGLMLGIGALGGYIRRRRRA